MAFRSDSIDIDATELADFEITVHLRSCWKLTLWLKLLRWTVCIGRALGFTVELTLKNEDVPHAQ